MVDVSHLNSCIATRYNSLVGPGDIAAMPWKKVDSCQGPVMLCGKKEYCMQEEEEGNYFYYWILAAIHYDENVYSCAGGN